MALTDADVNKQLQHMMAFIDQEANEKAEEIDAKAEEEFNIEKGRLVQQGRLKIMEFYDRKQKQIDLQKKIQSSNMFNQARLKVLKAREDHVRDIVQDGAKGRLAAVRSDQKHYPGLLRNLIIQGLYQLLEPTVNMRCRQDDYQLVQQLAHEAVQVYKQESKRDVKISIDDQQWLPAESVSGGVEMWGKGGKIRVTNTLENRLDLVKEEVMPDIRNILFGKNENRKFMD